VLIESGLVSKEFGQTIISLQRLRDLAAGNPSDPLDATIASDYVSNVEAVVEILEHSTAGLS
jgi:hypothetical protein